MVCVGFKTNRNKGDITMEKVWKSRKRTLFLGLPFSFTKYSLTEEKLLIETGFFNKREEEVRLYRILDLSLNRSFAQRLAGLGTITCKTSDKTLSTFDLVNIRKSRQIKEMLSDLIEAERVKKRVFSRENINDSNDDDCCCDHDHDHDNEEDTI